MLVLVVQRGQLRQRGGVLVRGGHRRRASAVSFRLGATRTRVPPPLSPAPDGSPLTPRLLSGLFGHISVVPTAPLLLTSARAKVLYPPPK
jgi:hypothetical protein